MTQTREPDAVVISLGAGVQSTVLTLLADRQIVKPMPDVFADTGAEPAAVYETLDWLNKVVKNFPIIRAQRQGPTLAEQVEAGNNERSMYGYEIIPAFTTDTDGSRGIIARRCTTHYKVEVIERCIREEILNLPPGRTARGYNVQQMLGITLDEYQRVRESPKKWNTLTYPLIDLKMTRADCEQWFGEHYPGRLLARSACYFCPYRPNMEWRNLRETDPDLADKAVKLDERLRVRSVDHRHLRGQVFLHRSYRPLSQAYEDITAQPSLFDIHADECAGVCFV